MKWKQALLGAAAILVFFAANAQAQTLQLAIIGSSAQFLEEGQAAGDPATGLGCYWTDSTKTDIEASDTVPGVTGSPFLDQASVWIAWQPLPSCASPTSGNVYIYLNTDSVVGNRCFFRANANGTTGCSIDVVNSSLAGQNGSGLFGTGFTDTAIPASIITAISGGHFNAAATDIRPEDAKFAINRVLAPIGAQMFPGSQYIGLGYSNGNTIQGTTLGEGASPFNVLNFNITGTDPFNTSETVPAFTVTQLGAVPIVVFVNPSNESGFGSLAVTNLERGTLAGYLDGTYKFTADAIDTQSYASTTKGGNATVFIREPLSGTYNTMEYNIPDSTQIQSSQDCGLAAYNTNLGLWNDRAGTEAVITDPPWNCGGTTPINPFPSTAGSVGAVNRAIGTGNEVKAVLAQEDSLGYAFWSAANFANATPANGKYLTVDGIDPIQENWVDGEIPTSSNGLLGDVSLAHVKDGSYPIWSILRIVSTTGVASTVATLITDAQRFLSPSQPDFVPGTQLFKVRSHFAPPGVAFPLCPSGYTPAAGDNGVTGGTACPATSVNNGDAGGSAESGGDVGGMPFGFQSDGDYNSANGVKTGHIGKRQ
jgi:hypothetical protein